MKIEQVAFRGRNWTSPLPVHLDSPETLVLAFFSPDQFEKDFWSELKSRFPRSRFFGATGGGTIFGKDILDSAVSLTVVRFDRTRLESGSVALLDHSDDFEAGKALAGSIPASGLKACYLLSDGSRVNGSALVAGLRSVLGAEVDVSGGLAGGMPDARATLVLENGFPSEGRATILGFYGNRVSVVSSLKCGWKPFGPKRTVTRSVRNVVHTIDGKPILGIYRDFLGDAADRLPGAGLFFPLFISGTGQGRGMIRTVLGINELDQSMTFAGEIPEGAIVQFARSSHESLISAAEEAAGEVTGKLRPSMELLGIVATCSGRRMILGEKTDQEIEEILNLLPHGATQTGFYSNGEFGVRAPGQIELHNQSIVVTLIQEWEID